ncbi:response regulator transcription factor [soil metagenome]
MDVTSNPNILVVEDDPAISSMLRRGLRLEGYDVQVENTGGGGIDAFHTERPALVILDIMLPGTNGIEVCRAIRSTGSDVPILMLTARDEIQDRVTGLDAGADDYLVKPFAFAELVARIRALLRRHDRDGQTDQESETLTVGDLRLDTGTRFAYRGERQIELTTREFDLLQLFMRNPNQVLSRDTIMDRVWGYDFPGESNVLEVYISSLRRHLEAEDEPRILATVRGAGYALRPSPE